MDGRAPLTYTVSNPAGTVTAREIGKGLPSGNGVRITSAACATAATAALNTTLEASAAALRQVILTIRYPLVNDCSSIAICRTDCPEVSAPQRPLRLHAASSGSVWRCPAWQS